MKPSLCSSVRKIGRPSPVTGFARSLARTPTRAILPPCCARAASGHATAPPPSSVMNSRRLVAREHMRDDGGRFTIPPPSRPEARSRLGSQSANELGAPVASSIPEQLPGHEPASARKGYEMLSFCAIDDVVWADVAAVGALCRPHGSRCADRFGRVKAVAARSAGARSASLDVTKSISDPPATKSQLLIRSPHRRARATCRGFRGRAPSRS